MEGVILTNERKQTVTTHNREFSINGHIIRECIVNLLRVKGVDIEEGSDIALMFDGREVYDGDCFYLQVNYKKEEEEQEE